MATPTTNVKVIFGSMAISKSSIEMTRVHTLEETAAMVGAFQKHGHDTIDTARVYGEGSSKKYLGNLDWPKRGIKMDTKLYPTALRPALSEERYHHSPDDLRRGLLNSLKSLKVHKVEAWYLHGPDRSVPFEVTLREVDKLHQEGYFERYGISNYQAWEVAKICDICEHNGWLKPAVYQGPYNAFYRLVEVELFPCLRRYGLAFYCFNPLAGGFITSRYKRDMTEFEQGSRFDPKRNKGKLHHGRYFDGLYFDALDILRPVAKKHGITEVQCALRWLSHHSILKEEISDGVIIGARSLKHIGENLEAFEHGSLPEDVVKALDDGWARIRGKELKYWH